MISMGPSLQHFQSLKVVYSRDEASCCCELASKTEASASSFVHNPAMLVLNPSNPNLDVNDPGSNGTSVRRRWLWTSQALVVLRALIVRNFAEHLSQPSHRACFPNRTLPYEPVRERIALETPVLSVDGWPSIDDRNRTAFMNPNTSRSIFAVQSILRRRH